MPRILLLALLSTCGFAADIVLSPESTMQKDASGRFLILTDGRDKTEYLVNVDHVVFVKAADANDNNSFTEIRVGLSDKDSNAVTIKIQQRVIPYEQVKQSLLQQTQR
jgi:hypothetical protein